MSTYRTTRPEVAVLTDAGWQGIPHVEEVTYDGRRATSDPLIDCHRPRGTYHWSPGGRVLDVPAAEPWTREGR